MKTDFTPECDRALAEWLGLDQHQHTFFECPNCNAPNFGTIDASSPVWVRECHGWNDDDHGCGWTGTDEECFKLNPYLTAPTPASDYAVLEAVRGKLANAPYLMNQWLIDIRFGTGATVDFLSMYQPGDYARAAFAVMQEQDKK